MEAASAELTTGLGRAGCERKSKFGTGLLSDVYEFRQSTEGPNLREADPWRARPTAISPPCLPATPPTFRAERVVRARRTSLFARMVVGSRVEAAPIRLPANVRVPARSIG